MIRADAVTFGYAGSGRPAVDGVSFSLEHGEYVAVVGANGSGKSTLARIICALVMPDSGSVSIDGFDAADPGSRAAVRSLVGLVQQDPRNQIVSSSVADEVAFGPRNLGYDPKTVSRRVREALSAVGLLGLEGRVTTELSGGEQQRLALAGVLAMDPRYLVLDEATSMLDGAARGEVRALISRLVRERGIGVLHVTHDPIDVLDADRVIELKDGRVAWSGRASAFRTRAAVRVRGSSGADAPVMWTDAYARVACEVERSLPGVESFSPDALARALDSAVPFVRARIEEAIEGGLRTWSARTDRGKDTAPRASLALEGATFSYGEHEVIRDATLSVAGGEVLLVAGASGSGKSTIARILAGLYRPDAGRALLGSHPPMPGEVGLAFQRPEDQLFCDTVRDDIAFAPRERGLGAEETERRVRAAARRMGISEEQLAMNPWELSGGYARRASIAALLAQSPDAYVFDEPTAGLDAEGRRFMHEVVRGIAKTGVPVAVVSHDVAEWLSVVDRVAIVAGGSIAWQGTVSSALDPAVYEAAGIRAPELIELAGLLGVRVGGDAL